MDEEGEDTFNPPSDEEEAVLVQLAQVPRVQPALRVQSLLCLLGHVEVTHEDVASPEADFAHSVLVWVVQLRLTTGEDDAAAFRGTKKKRRLKSPDIHQHPLVGGT